MAIDSRDLPAAGDRRRVPGTWFEVGASIPGALEDQLIGELSVHGAIGSTTAPAGPRRLGLTAWFDELVQAEYATRWLQSFPGVRLRHDQPRAIVDAGWLEATLRPHGPIRAGRFSIHAGDGDLTGDPPGGLLTIVLPPGRAFGTGEHATTALCLELISERDLTGTRVLDLGTGSGILAIAAARAGSDLVIGLDSDRDAIPVARENLQLNQVEHCVRLASGSLDQLGPAERFDLVLANIHRSALVRLARRLAAHLSPNGAAIVSGFTPEDAEQVQQAWLRHSLQLASRRERGEWCALEFAAP